MTNNVRSVRGTIVALVTPFAKDGSIDFFALKKLVELQILAGSSAISPCGTTGEAPTLSEDEYEKVVATVVDAVAGRVPVIAGAGSNSTEHAVYLTKRAHELGADAVLSVAPYYNKPTQEGYLQHFRAVSRAAKIPVLLYNVPGRTGSNIEPRTILKLSEIENIYGVKEASGSVMQYQEILASRRKEFMVYTGDDAFTLAMLALGGDGVVSVAANEIPQAMSDLCAKFFAGDLNAARQIHYKYLPLMNANFIESNPIPVKYALSRMKLIEEAYRLPLTAMAPENKERFDLILKRLEVI